MPELIRLQFQVSYKPSDAAASAAGSYVDLGTVAEDGIQFDPRVVFASFKGGAFGANTLLHQEVSEHSPLITLNLGKVSPNIWAVLAGTTPKSPGTATHPVSDAPSLYAWIKIQGVDRSNAAKLLIEAFGMPEVKPFTIQNTGFAKVQLDFHVIMNAANALQVNSMA